MNRWAWPLALLSTLAASQPALAKGDGEQAFLIGVVGVGILALFAFLTGLAAHALILGHAPRRARGLVAAGGRRNRWKTLILGIVNTFALAVVFRWSEHRAPPLAVLTFATWCVAILVGGHGIARNVGRAALGVDPDEVLDAAAELRGVALGWFVLCFASAIPLLGYALWFYWSVRSTGVVAYALLAPDEPDLEPSFVSPDPKTPPAP